MTTSASNNRFTDFTLEELQFLYAGILAAKRFVTPVPIHRKLEEDCKEAFQEKVGKDA